MLTPRKKTSARTTNPYHRFYKYNNIIKDVEVTIANQVWVSDITYIKTVKGFCYLALITDMHSRKIVGYDISDSLELKGCVRALNKAIYQAKSINGLVHHSDRGIQYCSSNYVKLLQDNDIQISMTENGDPLENAIAERINGIIKDEYLDCYQVENIMEAKELLKQVIELYNDERPHMSIGNMKPSQVHQTNQKTVKLWKNYYQKNTTLVK